MPAHFGNFIVTFFKPFELGNFIRRLKSQSSFYFFDSIICITSSIGGSPNRKHLPKNHTKAPHIRSHCEDASFKEINIHPFPWNISSILFQITGFLIEGFGQSKISNFCQIVFTFKITYENITCSQVAMHDFH